MGRTYFFKQKPLTAQNTTRCLRKTASIFGIGFDTKLYFEKGLVLFVCSFFFFRLFPIRGYHSPKVFSTRLCQLRLSLSCYNHLHVFSHQIHPSPFWPSSLFFTKLRIYLQLQIILKTPL